MRSVWMMHLAMVGIFGIFFLGMTAAHACTYPERLARGLEQADVVYYSGDGVAGGLAHINYWTIDPATLPEREQQKVARIKANQLHSSLFQPYQIISGHEVTGILDVQGRRQWISLKLPDDWNGKLVVLGTPGLRNEFANEAIFVPWLLELGYAVIAGNKGLESSWVSMLSGTHPSQHWGQMMHDLARWARIRLIASTYRWVHRIYAAGLSNGGYQVRRALEIDNARSRWRRLFHGGLDWSGTYFADEKVLDTNKNGEVSLEEYAAATTLISHTDTACQAMGWAYSPDTLTTPEEYAKSPRYPDAHKAMLGAGYNALSDIFWGFYNTNYDAYKAIPGFAAWQGVGYHNLISYVYRAELLGHDAAQAQAYSCFYDPGQPDQHPPLYDWLETVADGGWTPESVEYALANANTAKFKVPMITIVGDADGLLAVHAHSLAYRKAVKRFGKKRLHRLYVIENGPHVDAHADGNADFDFNGIAGDENADLELTPMQAYAQRAFMYLEDWVEKGVRPPKNKTVATDPTDDIDDAYLLDW